MTYEQLKKINENLETIDIEKKGKDGSVKTTKYAMVVKKVDAFRQLYPDGAITTEIRHFDDTGLIVIKATVCDEQGTILATGHAYEKENSSFINKTSFIENCETSAVGRALGFLGIGDDSIASAEEVATAITQQQGDKREASDTERAIFTEYCERLNVKPQDILRKTGWESGKMTVEHYAKALVILKDIDNGS